VIFQGNFIVENGEMETRERARRLRERESVDDIARCVRVGEEGRMRLHVKARAVMRARGRGDERLFF